MGTVSTSTMVRPVAPAGQVKGAQVKGAFWALLAFVVVYCARPEDWIPGLALIPTAKIAGALAVVAFLFSISSARRKMPREIIYFGLLIVQMGLSAILSPVWRGGASQVVLNFSKLTLILPVMVMVTLTLAQLRRLIYIQVASAAMIASVSIYQNRKGVDRLMGAANGTYSNSNDLAMTMCVALPFCFAFLLTGRGVLRKVAWALAMLVMTYTVFLTGSRSGLLALIFAGGACLWEFGIKGGRRYLVVLGCAAAVVLALVGGSALRVRLAASVESEESTQDAQIAHTSEIQRKALLIKSLVVTAQHPLFGVGAGNFQVVSGMWHETHNSYTQVSSEGGVPALILYLLILWRAFANVGEAKQRAPAGKEELVWVSALRASLLGFVVGSAFASVAYLLFPYFLVAYTSILHGVVFSDEVLSPKPVAEKQAPKLDRSLFAQGRALGP